MKRVCLITGARGFLGGSLAAYLHDKGFIVRKATRKPEFEDEVAYRLGQPLAPGIFHDVDALIHCAYDFKAKTWDEIASVNVDGSKRLFDQANASGVRRILYISSISAFTGCSSLYGRAKLAIEAGVLKQKGIVVRPGLIYSDGAGGMYGRLRTRASKGGMTPRLAGSPCYQYLIHLDDLCAIIAELLRDDSAFSNSVLTLAHPDAIPLVDLLKQLATNDGKTIRFLPVPWPFVWIGLVLLEKLQVALEFKSDNVVSIVYQDPHPNFSSSQEFAKLIRPYSRDP